MSVGLGWIRTVQFHPACFTRPTLPQLAITEDASKHAVRLRLLQPKPRSQIRRVAEDGDDAMSRALLSHVLHCPPHFAYTWYALLKP